jgi:geranylgeranyl pyrophosphate synthase
VAASVRESGAIAQALERAGGFVTQSQAALAALPEGEPLRILHGLAEYTMSRQK